MQSVLYMYAKNQILVKTVYFCQGFGQAVLLLLISRPPFTLIGHSQRAELGSVAAYAEKQYIATLETGLF